VRGGMRWLVCRYAPNKVVCVPVVAVLTMAASCAAPTPFYAGEARRNAVTGDTAALPMPRAGASAMAVRCETHFMLLIVYHAACSHEVTVLQQLVDRATKDAQAQAMAGSA